MTSPYFVARERAMSLILGTTRPNGATMTDLARYLVDSQTVPSFWHRYEFPNGHTAAVVVDPRPQHPFRFEVESSDPDDDGRGGIAPGLSTAEVEAKLATVAALPALDADAA